jgi:hypothetical protein
MIIIQNERKFTDAEFHAIDVLWRHHSINFPLARDLGGFMKKALLDIYNAIMALREPELRRIREQMPRLKKFKFNYKPLLDWHKEQRGFKRFALGFSDSRKSRRAMKKAGLIVGDLKNIVDLAEKMIKVEESL